MKRIGFALLSIVALSSVAASAEPLTIPLEYEAYSADEARIIVRTIQVAAFDMLAEPERKPGLLVSLGRDTRAEGMRLAEAGWGQAPEVQTVRGRDCGVSTQPITLHVDKGWMNEPADLFLLVEYCDEGTDRMGIAYAVRKNEATSFARPTGIDLERTGTWKRAQVKLTGAFLGGDGEEVHLYLYPVDTRYRPWGSTQVSMMNAAPSGEWKFPEFGSKRPLYGWTELGERRRLMVLDVWDALDGGGARIYFDADANGDLTDDPRIDGEIRRFDPSYFSAEFPPLDTEITVGGRQLPYSLRVYAYAFRVRILREGEEAGAEVQYHVSIRPACCYKAKFDLDGHTYRLLLADRNANGRFGDRFTKVDLQEDVGAKRLYPDGDRLLIREETRPTRHDEVPLGGILVLREHAFRVRIDTAEPKMILDPVTDGLCALEPGMGVERIFLAAENPADSVAAFDPGPRIMVPAGKYRLLTYVARRMAGDDEWILVGQGTENGPQVGVAGGEGTVLPLGEPFTPRAGIQGDIAVLQPRGQPVRLQFYVEGQGKERVSDLGRLSGDGDAIPMSVKDSSRPREPSYKIVKADGEIVASGTFEYG